MDITRTQYLAPPTVRARFAPVFWEPLPGSGERVCAIVLLAPELDSTLMLTPAAYVVINGRRLKAMLGVERGESAMGILNQAAEFMTQRLLVDPDLEACAPLFRNFSVGTVRSVKGFSVEQVLDAAVRVCSSFGSADELLDEVQSENNHSTATTREFLQRVQTAFAPADDERRQRFLRRVTLASSEVVIDYVHQQHLVQFATAPITERQAINMKREAEAKLFETISVQKTVLQQQAKPLLLINTAPLHGGLYPPGGQDVAQRTMAHYAAIAELHDFDLQEVASHDEAVHVLMDLR